MLGSHNEKVYEGKNLVLFSNTDSTEYLLVRRFNDEADNIAIVDENASELGNQIGVLNTLFGGDDERKLGYIDSWYYRKE